MADSSAPVVLVTGATEGGIGYALCKAFAKRGCRVYGAGRRPEAIEPLKSFGAKPVILHVDDEKECREVVASIVKEAGRIDILVNNAGAGATGALLDFDIDDAEAVLKTNVLAPLRLSQIVAPYQAAQFKKTGRRGLIANVGSIVGDIVTPWAGIYATSKAALHGLTNVLRMETQGLGIDVMLIAPGAVTSGFGKRQTGSLKLKEDTLYKSVEPFIKERAMMGQMNAMPTDVFATLVVSAALQPRRSPYNPLALVLGKGGPPAYFSQGGRAWQFYFLSFLPNWFKWRMIAKSTGCHRVK